MDYKYILRDIKLYKLTEIPMSTKASRFVKFWDELWTGMKVKIDPTKGEIKCWKDDYDQYYFIQNDKNDYLWCDYHKVGSFFVDVLYFNYDDTLKLIQLMVGDTLNYVINTPYSEHRANLILVRDTLNYVINTPELATFNPTAGVGETFNYVVNAPALGDFMPQWRYVRP